MRSAARLPQLIIALVVTPEGFPLSYEVFAGNRADVTTLEEMLDAVERKHGRDRRVWIFDRGIVSEDNLQRLRERGVGWGLLDSRQSPGSCCFLRCLELRSLRSTIVTRFLATTDLSVTPRGLL